MAQEFFINKNSTLPMLKMELINDGRTDFNKFYEMIQNSIITFSMEDVERGVLRISNEPALVIKKENTFEEEYYIAYKWKPKDTTHCGKFKGFFNIVFSDVYGGGSLIVPIKDHLYINII